MKNLDIESWEKEHKDINNNLAVPSYRAFCKAYGINFHFGDEIKNFDHNRHPAILLDEMPLHGKALSLFNFVNKPYHPFRDSLVSFVYTSWDDFRYESLSLEEVAREMENKDVAINRLKIESTVYGAIALIYSLLLTGIVVVKVTDIDFFVILALIICVVLLMIVPNAIYSRRKKVEQQKFEMKLSELKRELQDISIRDERNKQ